MNIEQEMLQLGKFAHIGMALMQYVQSKKDGQWVKNSDYTWIYLPDNFVAFYIAYKRVKHLKLYVRNVRVPEQDKEIIKLWAGHRYWPYVDVESPKQFGALFRLIDASFQRGSYRRTRWQRDMKRSLEGNYNGNR
jgi:hypothetical protein